MSSITIYNEIKKTVQSMLPDSRVLLFGSHAKGTFDSHSDYDLLVIIPDTPTQKERLTWTTRLDNALIKAIHAPVDLLLYSEDEVHQKQILPGHIVRTAMREGIAL